MKCTATSKRTRGRCGANAMTGRTVCYHHGGRSPAGIASATYKHGDRSAHLPNRLLKRYQGAMTDPELLDLSVDLATVEARIADVLGRVETGEAGETWVALQAAWEGLWAAQKTKNPDRVRLAFARVEQTIATGAGDWAAWCEVLDLVERRRRLVESEGRRRVRMEGMMETGRVLQIADLLAASVKRHVRDDGALRAIQRDMAALLLGDEGRGDGGVAAGSGSAST